MIEGEKYNQKKNIKSMKDRGSKWQCPNCNVLVYDLLRERFSCPKCRYEFINHDLINRNIADRKAKERIQQKINAQIEKAKKTEQENEFLKKAFPIFENNFLYSESYLRDKLNGPIDENILTNAKIKFVIEKIKKLNNNFEPSYEQALAIGAGEKNIQLIARAGSGKTSTLVNRALFLIKNCNIHPNEILLLAFNKDAASEIKQRIKETLGDPTPNAMTFHALAYSLVHPEKSILFDEPDGGETKSRFMQSLIDEMIHSDEFYEKIKKMMINFFRLDWAKIEKGGFDKSPEEMLKFRRSLINETLDGKYVKSLGEKIIANFLFEHRIEYQYERNFFWNGINYRPDFTIPDGKKGGLIIEYLGLEGEKEYDEEIIQKREYWSKQKDWKYLEIKRYPRLADNVKNFQEFLKTTLLNFNIELIQMSDLEIWEKIKVRSIDYFSKLIVQFIGRSRKLNWGYSELNKKISEHISDSDAETQFLELAPSFFNSYLKKLKENGEDDFDGLIQKATDKINQGLLSFKRKSGSGRLDEIKYILIDEYQDFSKLFYNMIEAIKNKNHAVKFFCVGDDWQAINAFAGSDLFYYNNFLDIFTSSMKLNMVSNFRSGSHIVDTGNLLMGNAEPKANPTKKETGKVSIADLNKFQPTPSEAEHHSGDIITPALCRIVNKVISQEGKLVILTRTNNVPYNITPGFNNSKGNSKSIETFELEIKKHFQESERHRIAVQTVHKYKGLEEDIVVILDALNRSYPLLHPNQKFNRVFGDSTSKTIKDEERLFYVAITRAVNQLIIITQADEMSPFLAKILSSKNVSSFNWNDLHESPCINNRLTVEIIGRDTYDIKEKLKAEKYKFFLERKSWRKTIELNSLSVENFINKFRHNYKNADIEIRFFDNQIEIAKQTRDNSIATYKYDGSLLLKIFDHTDKL